MKNRTTIFARATKFFLFAFITLLSIPAISQVSTTYTFAQSVGTYTNATGGTVVSNNTALFNTDDYVFGPITMPTPFSFDGVSYPDIYISTNGFVAFGSSPSDVNYNPISGTDAPAGIISAFGADLDESGVASAPNATIRYLQVGTEFVVQWTNFGRFGDADRISFQIRLNTANNQIKIVYGGTITKEFDATGLEVGLRGPNNTFPTNINNRQVLPNSGAWAISTAGTSNASTCDFDQTNPATTPAVGTTFTWSVPAVDMAALTLTLPTNAGCYSAPQPVSVSIVNSGSALINFATNPVTVSCSVTGPNPTVFTPVVVNTGTLAVNATRVVPIVLNYNMSVAGNYVFSASTSTTGDTHTGNNAMAPVTINSHNPSIVASADVAICSGTSTNLTTTTAAFPYNSTITNNTNLSIPDNVPAGVNQTMVVSGISAAPSSVTLTINSLTHTFDGDLIFTITAPNGSSVVFCNQEGGGGANFTNTAFSSSAITPIASGNAPFTGSFLPENPFSALTGSSNGNWVINVSDNAAADVGVLHSWSLTFNNTNSIITYAWSPATGLSSSSIANPVANPTTTTNYSVTVTDASGCTNSDQVLVTVNPLPTVTANSTAASVCTGNSVTLTGGGATSYTWTGSVTNGVSFVPVSTNTYTVTGTDANGCQNTANTTVTVNPTPTVTATAGTPTICSGSSSTLTGNGAATYTWMPGSLSGTTVTVSPTTTTTYTVTGTSGSGCSSTGNVTVTVNPTPTVTATAGTPTICSGSSSTLTGNGAATYTWMPGSLSGTTVTVSPTTTTTYTVTGTSGSGCSSTGNVTVTVNPTPTVTATAGTPTICSGSSSTLTGNGAATYTWMPGSLSGTTVTVSPTTTTTYTVTGTSGSGCSSTGNVTVTVNPTPTVTATAGTPTICSGSSSTLTGNGAATYTWMPGSLSGTTVTVSPTTTTNYTVTGTSGSGCTNTGNVTVTVNPTPTVTATAGTPTICSGSSSTLTGNGAATYTWMPGSLSGTTVTVSPTTTTNYTVTGTSGSGCTNTGNVTVTVNPLPTVTANSTASTVCTGSSVTLTGSGAVSYSWTGSVTDGVSFIPASTNTYTVTGTDANGCQNTDNTTVTVNPTPTVTATAASPTICSGSSTTLTGNGATTYTWMPGSLSGTTVTVSPTTTTTYTVTGTSGCSSTGLVTVTVNSLPTVTANSTASTVCNGNSVTLTGGGAVSYTWTNSVTDGVAFNPASTITYTVTGTDANGCQNTASTTVNVNALPSVTANSTATIVCEGSSVTLTGSGAVSYSWSGSVSDGVSFIPPATNTYTVTGTDGNGCSGSDMITVTVTPLPAVTANSSAASVCTGNSVTLTGGGAVSYSWDNSVIDGISFVPSATTTYMVTGIDANGCQNTATTTVTVNSLPTVTANSTAPTVCSGSPVTLTGSGATSYTWTNSVTDGVAFNPTSTNTYTVTGTDANGCSGTDMITVSVNPLPNVTLNFPTDTVCVNGGNFTLSGESPAGGVWTGNGVTGNIFDPLVPGVGFTLITYFYSDLNGCSATDTSSLWVDVCNGLSTVNSGSMEINAYPNPNNGVFTLNIKNSSAPEVHLEIVDLQGQLIYNEMLGGVTDDFTKQIDLSTFANGSYFLKVTIGNETQMLKVFKQD